MLITGYQLLSAIRDHEKLQSVLLSRFSDSLQTFEGETAKVSPEEAMKDFDQCTEKLVHLQVAQVKYNLLVIVEVQGVPMPLLEAIRKVGTAGVREKKWRSAVAAKKNHYGDTSVRRKDEEHAKRTVTQEEALKEAQKAAKYASALRAAIAGGNATSVEIMGLEPSMLE